MTGTLAWFLMSSLCEGDLENPFYCTPAPGMAYTLLRAGTEWRRPSN